MSSDAHGRPLLEEYYQKYLASEDSARFVHRVASHYTIATLERLLATGDRMVRRGAAMAVGYLGTFRSNAALGRALRDQDRGVRILAENGIRDLWCRDGTPQQRRDLAVLVRMNDSQQHHDVVRRATWMIDECPWFAEVWHQRGVAYFQLRRFQDSANDCQQTLELNPYHFGAMCRMAYCYLEMREPNAALDCFRRTLGLNPSLDAVRAQAEYLQRTLE